MREEANETTMSMRTAMELRHMVRKYLDKPIEKEVAAKLAARVDDVNARYGTAVKLMLDDDAAYGTIVKMLMARGVRNYLIMAGAEAPDVRKRLGMAGAELMLYAQTLGLNTWWAGGVYRRSAMTEAAGEPAIGVVAVGYGATQGKPHKSKSPEDVSAYEGEPPAWFSEGVRAALLAPTAMNKQAFFVKGSGDSVRITYKPGMCSGEDLGLVKYHFQLGAGPENFRWAE